MIQAEGFPLPIPIAVGINDAAQLFHAAGGPAAAARTHGRGQTGLYATAATSAQQPRRALLPALTCDTGATGVCSGAAGSPSGCACLPLARRPLPARQGGLRPPPVPAGPEFRRPSTMTLWVRSLQAAGAQVDRVLITRLGGCGCVALQLRPCWAALRWQARRACDALCVAALRSRGSRTLGSCSWGGHEGAAGSCRSFSYPPPPPTPGSGVHCVCQDHFGSPRRRPAQPRCTALGWVGCHRSRGWGRACVEACVGRASLACRSPWP